jgi:hypothetical protein
MGSGGHNTSTSVLYVDRAVAFDAGEAERHALETLAGHRLDGIAPEFSEVHARLPFPRVST